MTLPGSVTDTAGTWHDHAPAVSAAAIARLRLAASDPDADRFPALAAAACSAIDQRLQLLPLPDVGRWRYLLAGVPVITYGPDVVPPDVVEAAVQLTVGLYHRKDAPLGVLGRGMGEGLYVSRDQLAQVSSLLDPYVEGVGLA